MMRALLLLAVPLAVAACGGSNPPPSEPTAATASTAPPAPAPPPAPPCTDGPANPAEVLTKEPQVLATCFAGTGKLDANLCGQAKIAVEIGKDGSVTRAEVASSTLPPGVTDCIKARLAAIHYACPKDGTATYTVPIGLPTGAASGACPGMPAQ